MKQSASVLFGFLIVASTVGMAMQAKTTLDKLAGKKAVVSGDQTGDVIQVTTVEAAK
jgi:hypothetical protein